MTATTLVDLLQDRAATYPASGYVFLDGGEREGARRPLADLDRRARAIGATLADRGLAGQRVLLLYLQGLEFVEAFFGALYAGAVPVPAHPPDPARLARTLPRLVAIATDAGVSQVLTTEALRAMAGGLLDMAPALGRLPWMASDAIPDAAASGFRPPDLAPGSPAIIQYTSGSTGTPRGVLITHGNVIHNVGAVDRRIGSPRAAAAVSWVPFYHDMGLIGGVVWSAYAALHAYLMSPLDFLARPVRWLTALSRTRAAFTCAPGFALDLCLRRVGDGERDALDLGALEGLFLGGEPLSAGALAAFAARFAPCGLRASALGGCYGLAETTMDISFARVGHAPRVARVDAGGIEAGRVVLRVEGEEARAIPSCNAPLEGCEVVLVRPDTGAVAAPDEVGEIWTRGPSVSPGYWERPEETAHTFGATLPDGSGPWLRTGDLGFLLEGELYVTGRIKDLIIVRGRNLYPHDLERTAEEAHPALRRGCAAAFALPGGATERVGLVLEASPDRLAAGAEAVIDAIRAAVAAGHDVAVHAVVLAAPRAVPKTSSGKIQRRQCRDAYLAGELEILAESVLAAEAPDAVPTPAGAVHRAVAEALGVAASELPPDRPLAALGLDSLRAAQLAERLSSLSGVEVAPSFLLGGATLAAVAALVETRRDATPDPADALPPIPAVPRSGEGPLSFTESALFRLVEMAPASPSNNLFLAVQIDGDLDGARLEASVRDLIARQESLRTRFVRENGRVVRRFDAEVSWSLGRLDLRSLPAPARTDALKRRALEVHTAPLDPAAPPLLVAELVRTSERENVLLLLLGHLVSDGWSFGVILRELGVIYESRRRGVAPALPPLPIQCLDFATWEQGVLDPAALGAELARAGSELVPLRFPLDRPLPAALDPAGARVDFTVSADLHTRLADLARGESVPLSAALIAAFQVLLHERTGQATVSFNLVHSDRQRLALQHVVGFFAYALILQEDVAALAHDPRALVRQTHARLARTEYKDRLRMVLRSSSNRVMLNLHSYAAAFASEGLAVSHRADLFQAINLWDAHDLILDLRDAGGTLAATFFYRPAVLDEGTIANLAERYLAALGRVAAG